MYLNLVQPLEYFNGAFYEAIIWIQDTDVTRHKHKGHDKSFKSQIQDRATKLRMHLCMSTRPIEIRTSFIRSREKKNTVLIIYMIDF